MSVANEPRHTNEHLTKQPPPPKEHFWTPSRLALACATLILVAVVGSSFCNRTPEVAKTNNRANSKVTTPNSANTGATSPEASVELPSNVKDTSIQALDGGTFKLSDYAGKVVVLDLWATWCPPCRDEIPHLVDLAKEYAGRGVEVIGLTVEDPESDAELVREFARDFEINYKIGWVERDVALTLMDGSGAIPQTFVISRDGRILSHLIGFDPRSSPAMLRQAVEQAIGDAH